jgi:preprotein translocase subunit SecG|tara:strand:+ start:438 stop:761 length:324 start_codon:yes stop_codon:yes gene_type:complete
MTTLIIIQLILAVLLVIFVLLQGSDNEGLGLGGGGGLGGMMSARGSANLLSRLTAITATLFMIMSVILTISASVGSDKNILESLPDVNTTESSTNNTSTEPSIPENN